MAEERLTELEHAAVARMDTREWLVQKANVLHKLARLIQWLKGGLQKPSILWYVARMDTKERLSESNMYVMDRLVQWF
jgi:hypothetical protein